MSRGPSLSSPWNDLLVEELKRLWAAGYSAGDIAYELRCVSRNAVIGKINRLGLERRRPPRQRKPRELTVKRGRPISRRPVFVSPLPLQLMHDMKPEPAPEPDKRQWHEAPDMRKLQLLALRDHHCRAPIGEPGGHPFYFCAADRELGVPYCPFHMRRAFSKPRGEK